MAEDALSKLKINRDEDLRGSDGHRRRGWAKWAAVLILVLGVVAGWRVREASAPRTVEVAVVAVAYPSQAYALLNATGYVVAQRKAAVASKATGRLEWLGVREGAHVRQGEIIARLENRDLTAAMEQAAAGVKLAQANLQQGQAELNDAERGTQRSLELLARNFVSQAAHDSTVARLDKARAAISGFQASIAVAEANLKAAQVNLEQTLIRAPFQGVVLTKNANVGDVITPFSSASGSQAAVVTLADMSTLEVEADVSESNLAKVKADQACEIQLDAMPTVRFGGKVVRLVPTVDRAKATVMAKISFDQLDPRILPEMSAKVTFLSQPVPADQRNARTAVQPSAVVERNGTTSAFVLKGERIALVKVETGGRLGELIEIRTGLKGGDRVVLKPDDKLSDGDRVAVSGK